MNYILIVVILTNLIEKPGLEAKHKRPAAF